MSLVSLAMLVALGVEGFRIMFVSLAGLGFRV